MTSKFDAEYFWNGYKYLKFDKYLIDSAFGEKSPANFGSVTTEI